MLPLRGRVNLGATAMKGYSAFPQSSSITEASPVDCLISYPGHSLGGGVLRGQQERPPHKLFFRVKRMSKLTARRQRREL